MDTMRWRLAPPLLAVTAFVVTAGTVPGPVGAADPPWDPPPCPAAAGPPGSSGGGIVGSIAGRIAAAKVDGVPWFRLDPVLDAGGTLVARRLAVGDAAAGSRRRLDLAAESFATGPFGPVVLVGSDDGRRSTLRIVDPVAGCADAAGAAASVVRSALLKHDGLAMVEHRVDRATRAD